MTTLSICGERPFRSTLVLCLVCVFTVLPVTAVVSPAGVTIERHNTVIVEGNRVADSLTISMVPPTDNGLPAGDALHFDVDVMFESGSARVETTPVKQIARVRVSWPYVEFTTNTVGRVPARTYVSKVTSHTYDDYVKVGIDPSTDQMARDQATLLSTVFDEAAPEETVTINSATGQASSVPDRDEPNSNGRRMLGADAHKRGPALSLESYARGTRRGGVVTSFLGATESCVDDVRKTMEAKVGRSLQVAFRLTYPTLQKGFIIDDNTNEFAGAAIAKVCSYFQDYRSCQQIAGKTPYKGTTCGSAEACLNDCENAATGFLSADFNGIKHQANNAKQAAQRASVDTIQKALWGLEDTAESLKKQFVQLTQMNLLVANYSKNLDEATSTFALQNSKISQINEENGNATNAMGESWKRMLDNVTAQTALLQLTETQNNAVWGQAAAAAALVADTLNEALAYRSANIKILTERLSMGNSALRQLATAATEAFLRTQTAATLTQMLHATKRELESQGMTAAIIDGGQEPHLPPDSRRYETMARSAVFALESSADMGDNVYTGLGSVDGGDGGFFGSLRLRWRYLSLQCDRVHFALTTERPSSLRDVAGWFGNGNCQTSMNPDHPYDPDRVNMTVAEEVEWSQLRANGTVPNYCICTVRETHLVTKDPRHIDWFLKWVQDTPSSDLLPTTTLLNPSPLGEAMRQTPLSMLDTGEGIHVDGSFVNANTTWQVESVRVHKSYAAVTMSLAQACLQSAVRVNVARVKEALRAARVDNAHNTSNAKEPSWIYTYPVPDMSAFFTVANGTIALSNSAWQDRLDRGAYTRTGTYPSEWSVTFGSADIVDRYGCIPSPGEIQTWLNRGNTINFMLMTTWLLGVQVGMGNLGGLQIQMKGIMPSPVHVQTGQVRLQPTPDYVRSLRDGSGNAVFDNCVAADAPMKGRTQRGAPSGDTDPWDNNAVTHRYDTATLAFMSPDAMPVVHLSRRHVVMEAQYWMVDPANPNAPPPAEGSSDLHPVDLSLFNTQLDLLGDSLDLVGYAACMANQCPFVVTAMDEDGRVTAAKASANEGAQRSSIETAYVGTFVSDVPPGMIELAQDAVARKDKVTYMMTYMPPGDSGPDAVARIDALYNATVLRAGMPGMDPDLSNFLDRLAAEGGYTDPYAADPSFTAYGTRYRAQSSSLRELKQDLRGTFNPSHAGVSPQQFNTAVTRVEHSDNPFDFRCSPSRKATGGLCTLMDHFFVDWNPRRGSIRFYPRRFQLLGDMFVDSPITGITADAGTLGCPTSFSVRSRATDMTHLDMVSEVPPDVARSTGLVDYEVLITASRCPRPLTPRQATNSTNNNNSTTTTTTTTTNNKNNNNNNTNNNNENTSKNTMKADNANELAPVRITKSMLDFTQWQQVTVDVPGCNAQHVTVRSRLVSAGSPPLTDPPQNATMREQAEWYTKAYPITCWAWLADPRPVSVKTAQAQVREQILNQKDPVSRAVSRSGEIVSQATYLAYDAIGIAIRNAFDDKRTADSAVAHAAMVAAEQELADILLNMTNDFAENNEYRNRQQDLMLHMRDQLLSDRADIGESLKSIVDLQNFTAQSINDVKAQTVYITELAQVIEDFKNHLVSYDFVNLMVGGAPANRSWSDLGPYLMFYSDIGCPTQWEQFNSLLADEVNCVTKWYDPRTWINCIRGPWIGLYYLILTVVCTLALVCQLVFCPVTMSCGRKRYCATISVCLTSERPYWWCGDRCCGKRKPGGGSHRNPKLELGQALAGAALMASTSGNHYRYTTNVGSNMQGLSQGQTGVGSASTRKFGSHQL
jgi:hypothetical protein